jgi:hypothetical protein
MTLRSVDLHRAARTAPTRYIIAEKLVSGYGNDSFHQFTHRLGLGEQPRLDRLGELLTNPDSCRFFGDRFFWLCRGREGHKKWKDKVPVSGHDKELFFRKWRESSGLGIYPRCVNWGKESLPFP